MVACTCGQGRTAPYFTWREQITRVRSESIPRKAQKLEQEQSGVQELAKRQLEFL